MLHAIIDYFRSCLCEHEWEFLYRVDNYDMMFPKYPTGHTLVYRCSKCGYIKKTRI